MKFLKSNYQFVILILLHLFLLTQLMYTVWPEMILYPYLMVHGFSLYKDIINPYFPLLQIISFAFFKTVGLSVLNLKLLTWMIIICSDLTLIYATSHFYKQKSKQLISLLAFILLQLYFEGNGLWFELALTPFIILSLTLVYFYPNNLKKIIISALLFSAAVLIKQNALFFLVPIGLFLFWQKQFRNLGYLILINGLVFGLTAILLYHFNVWSDFLTWAIKLPLVLDKQHGFIDLPAFHQYPLILFPMVTLVPFLLDKKIILIQKIFWLLCFLIALQFAFPRFENFHLQLLAGLSSIFVPTLSKRYLLGFFVVVLVLFSLFFVKNFHKTDRFLDPRMFQLADQIKNYPSVYILNDSDLSYYFANQLPPKPWAINFPWYFEFDNFENRFTYALTQQKTEYIIFGNPIGGGEYSLGNYIPAGLMQFIGYNYIQIERNADYTVWQAKSNSH